MGINHKKSEKLVVLDRSFGTFPTFYCVSAHGLTRCSTTFCSLYMTISSYFASISPVSLKQTKKNSAGKIQRRKGMRQRSTLPGRHQPSTIDVLGLNFCVRDGNRWTPLAITTGYSILRANPQSYIEETQSAVSRACSLFSHMLCVSSLSRLSASLSLAAKRRLT